MRRFLTLRWLGLHAAMVVIFVGFLALGWWQLTRAEGGNALSWGYTFEWPVFAIFVVVFWVKMMRDELREARQREAGGDGGGSENPADGEPAAGTAGEPLTLPAGIRARRSPAAGPADPDDEPDDELAAYNAYLAQLNAETGSQPGSVSGRGVRRHVTAARSHAAAARSQPRPPSGDLEV
jgi:hypothetical protein